MKYDIPTQLRLRKIGKMDMTEDTKVFESSDDYFRDRANSMGLSISSPIFSGAFGMSNERAEMRSLFEKHDLQVVNQLVEKYELTLNPGGLYEVICLFFACR